MNGLLLGVIASGIPYSPAPPALSGWVAGHDSGFAARSTGDGVTWTALTQGLNSGSVGSAIYAVATDGVGIWVTGHDSGYAARSTDNGVTWSSLPQGLNSGIVTADIYAVAAAGV